MDGERQVPGIDVGASEDAGFWTAFLRSLVKRGLSGVRLVIPDAHEGLKHAIGTVLSGAAWQCCRVHFMRNLLARVPQGMREAVAAILSGPGKTPVVRDEALGPDLPKNAVVQARQGHPARAACDRRDGGGGCAGAHR